MIQSLNSSLPFTANKMPTSRDVYQMKMDANSKILEQQNKLVDEALKNSSDAQQENGKNIDTVA